VGQHKKYATLRQRDEAVWGVRAQPRCTLWARCERGASRRARLDAQARLDLALHALHVLRQPVLQREAALQLQLQGGDEDGGGKATTNAGGRGSAAQARRARPRAQHAAASRRAAARGSAARGVAACAACQSLASSFAQSF
jgi:hypothetical protein